MTEKERKLSWFNDDEGYRVSEPLSDVEVAKIMNDPELTQPYTSYNFVVDTPDGRMYVAIMEDRNKRPSRIEIKLGKVGSPVSAWADALGRVISTALASGTPLHNIAEEISTITSSRSRIDSSGKTARSGPEGVVIALMQYRRAKYDELAHTIGLNNDGPSIGG